jgi:glyoxylase-like metal-dependent hydrolase (beta-lactamase superfamily II)
VKWHIGNVTITRVPEFEAWPADGLVPKATADELASFDWLSPYFVTPEGLPFIAIQAFVIESEGKTIVVDGGIGNGKTRSRPRLNGLNTDFMNRFSAEGFDRDSVDIAVSTHIHSDHVGWNTMLVDEQWVPTYPRATYVFVNAEWEHASQVTGELLAEVVDDSVRPIVDRGLAELVAPPYPLTGEVTLEATPGHTPAHASVWIRSGGQTAAISGDILHHPAQIGRPEWGAFNDFDPATAESSRRSFIDTCADSDALVFGTHFPAPVAGYILSGPEGYRFRVE